MNLSEAISGPSFTIQLSQGLEVNNYEGYDILNVRGIANVYLVAFGLTNTH
jgi:hypothetical protein